MKRPEFVTTELGIYLLCSIPGFLASSLNHFPIAIPIAFLVISVALSAHRETSSWIAWLWVKQRDASLMFGFGFLLLAGLLSFRLFGQATPSWSGEMLTHAVLGLATGALALHVLLQLNYYLLDGQRGSGWEYLFLAVWTAGALQFPFETPDQIAYLSGLSLGIILHKSVRVHRRREQKTYERFHSIHVSWNPEMGLEAGEREAVTMLCSIGIPDDEVEKDLEALHAHLATLKAECALTPFASLISAIAHRLEGRHSASILDAQVVGLQDLPKSSEGQAQFDAGSSNDFQGLLTTHLLLIQTLGHRDRGDFEKATVLANELKNSSYGLECPLTQAICAELNGHTMFGDSFEISTTDVPLELANRAKKLSAEILRSRSRSQEIRTKKELVVRLTEAAVPTSAALISNVLGQSQLLAGYPEEARLYLTHAITMDPTMSSAYLNLGKYYLTRDNLRHQDGVVRPSNVRNARTVFYAASLSCPIVASPIRTEANALYQKADEWLRERAS